MFFDKHEKEPYPSEVGSVLSLRRGAQTKQFMDFHRVMFLNYHQATGMPPHFKHV